MIALIWVVPLISAVFLAQPAEDDPQYLAADSLFEKEHFDKAMELYSQEVELRFQLSDTVGWSAALEGKVKALLGMGEFEDALQLAEEELELTLAVVGTGCFVSATIGQIS